LSAPQPSARTTTGGETIVHLYRLEDIPGVGEVRRVFESELGALSGEKKTTAYDGRSDIEYRER
jgi:hypothetical protein